MDGEGVELLNSARSLGPKDVWHSDDERLPSQLPDVNAQRHAEMMRKLEDHGQLLAEVAARLSATPIPVRTVSALTVCKTGSTPEPEAPSQNSAPFPRPHRPSFTPKIFRTFTQADAALQQKAANEDESRARRLFSSATDEAKLTWMQIVASHPAFHLFFAVVVLTNSVFIGAEVQDSLQTLGPTPLPFQIGQYIYTTLFLAELSIRIAAEGWRFLFSKAWMWNWLDVLVVVSSLIEICIDAIYSAEAAGIPTISGFKAFRVVRVTRFLKTLRVLRIFQFVLALRTLLTSIMFTLKSLFWALALLLLIVYVFGVLISQGVNDHIHDPSSMALSDQDKFAVHRFFRSLPQTMLTLFMSIAGGVSWEEVATPLQNISVFWLLILLFYVMFTYFAVLNVLTGVFCQSAIESAQNDHANLVQSMLANKETHLEKIRMLFSKLGANETGAITYQMFYDGVQTPAVQEYLETLGLDVWDAWSFFKMLDLDAGGSVEIEEFFKGCLRLRGQARSIDVGKILHDQAWLIKNQGRFQTYMEVQIRHLSQQLASLTGNMESPDTQWMESAPSAQSAPSNSPGLLAREEDGSPQQI